MEAMNDDMDMLGTEAFENKEWESSGEYVGIISQPIRDGSQAIAHDGFDVQVFNEALQDYPELANLVTHQAKQLITSQALIQDLFWSFYKPDPRIDPVVPITPAHHINHTILAQIMGTREWELVRVAGTVGDIVNSAIATIGAAQTAIASLDRATLEQINALAAAESGATSLFAQAEALTDLAEQATGDSMEALHERAEQARREAEAQRAQAEAIVATLEQSDEAIEDVSRRAARKGLQQAQQQIEAADVAIRAFGGGYGPGIGLSNGPKTTKEKMELAQRVQRSRRLKEIAAACGRFTRIALRVQETKIDQVPAEVADIVLGDDLARILPSELALLADDTLELAFFRRFAEKELLQFKLDDREKQGQGPIICVVDSSGSMQGENDIWAKAVMLALMAVARLQQRDMAVLHFSDMQHHIMRFDFPKGTAPYQQVVACSDYFIGQGTAFEPWMNEALQIVNEHRYQKADLIIISDGLPNNPVAPTLLQQWQDTRRHKDMKAYGVLIGTDEGAVTLAKITDALLTLGNLQEDSAILETIFAV